MGASLASRTRNGEGFLTVRLAEKLDGNSLSAIEAALREGMAAIPGLA